MATLDDDNQYYTFDSRLASFKTAQSKPKRRTSVASKKNQKTGGWPHSFLAPELLAEAGFYYAPNTDADDNVTCFLCEKSLDGWEEGDDALTEHLKHSSGCGWAIVATVFRGDEQFKNEDPMSERMKQARRDTFGDVWPHDGKKGWLAKSKQMADSGWIYTPTRDSDDNATCVYCNLSLDAWEPKDKPTIEHQNRSDDCAFFRLLSEFQSGPGQKKVAAKSKSARASKASRLSTQSNITLAQEAPSFADEPAEQEDSIMTTATIATVQSRAGGKAGKGNKASTAKGRKTRAKKQEPEEVIAPEPADDIHEVEVDSPKITKGKKRASDQMDEENSIVAEQPPPTKRRITRTRGSMALQESTISATEQSTEELVEQPVAAARKRGRPSRASRKISTASVAAEPIQIPDDDAIDRALEADLERPLTDDENNVAHSETQIRRVSRTTTITEASPKAGTRRTRASVVSNPAISMFDSQPVDIDESSIEKELAAMEIEESKPLPKGKAAKAKQPRKPSAKQLAAAKKAEEAAQAAREAEEATQAALDADAMVLDTQQHEEPPGSPSPAQKAPKARTRQPRQIQAQSTRASVVSVDVAVDSYFPPQDDLSVNAQENDSGNDTDNSMASQSTVIRGGKTRRGSALKKGRGGKKAMSRHIEDIIHKDVTVTPPAKQTAKSKKGKEIMRNMEDDEGLAIFEDAVESEVERVVLPAKDKSKKDKGKGKVLQELPIDPAPSAATPSSLSVPFSPKLVSSSRKSPQPPLTPGAQANASPSPSPQSSDAENHPPSSKPSAVRNSLNLQDTTTNKQTTRVPLVSTPTGSPSKRNTLNGLQTSQPWTTLDLDTIFAKSPPKDDDVENRDPGRLAFNEILERARTGDITSPEKNMTVEQWIIHNAEVAEAKLRRDCERMVGVFEDAGQRAMRSVEGIKCLDDE